MQGNSVKIGGSPTPQADQSQGAGTATSISTANREKDNSIPGDLLTRTIACRPPNEDRLRGIAA
jgi:hypothetical protein